MSSKSEISTTVVAEETGPAFVDFIDPITKEPILLRDPKLQVVEPKRAALTCETIDSFGAAVNALAGPNKLVELRSGGRFFYRNDLAGLTTRTVSLELEGAPTAPILCLDGPKSFKQRTLVKWAAQWPDVLQVYGGDPDMTAAALAAVEHFEFKGAVSFNAVAGDQQTSLSALRENADPTTTKIPLYWQATSPVFQDGKPQVVKLRLEVLVPEIKDGKLEGELAFRFELWSPDTSQITDAAMADAIQRMSAVLPDDMTIIRGSIA